MGPLDARLPCSRPRRWAFALSVALVTGITAGCGGSGEVTAGSGGAGGNAGAGGGSAGTNAGGSAGTAGTGTAGSRGDGGPRPPAAQGSVSLHLAELDDTSVVCSPGRQWINTPSKPVVVQTQQVSGADFGTKAFDGVDGARVVCSVRKLGDKYELVADITTPRTDGTAVLHPTILHFEARAIAPSGPAVFGTVTAMTDTTHANFADDACAFSVTPEGGATQLAVDSGKIWTSIRCERFAHPTETDDVCRIDAGFAVFENCAQ